MDTTPDWSKLPQDLLRMIGKCFDGRLRNDLARFRAVCKDFWSCSASPLKLQSPCTHGLKLPKPTGLEHFDSNHVLLSEWTVYAIQPCLINETWESRKTWFLEVEETNSSGVQVWDTLRRFRKKMDLKYFKLPYLNLLDYQVTKITKFYQLRLPKDFTHIYFDPIMNQEYILSKRVALSKSLDEMIEIDDDGFTLMATINGILRVWRNGDKNWTNIRSAFGERVIFYDVCYHQGKFYAMYVRKFEAIDTVIVDPKSLTITRVSTVHMSSSRFLKSQEDLFMIEESCLPYNITTKSKFGDHLKVYKLDEDKHEWVRVNELDDKILFMGDRCSFSISTKEFPQIKRNCVYFTCEDIDEYIDIYSDDEFGYDIRIFDMEDQTFLPALAPQRGKLKNSN